MRKPYRTARPNPRLLEPRMVFDAAVAAVSAELAADAVHVVDLTRTVDTTESLLVQQSESLPQAPPPTRIAFVDASLLKDGAVPGLADGVALVALRPDEDGIAQISAALRDRSDISAIYLVTHGEAGRVSLGATGLDSATLALRAGEVAAWAPSLSAGADILLYGCQAGSGGEGRQLMQALANLTGADVAASANNTGPASLGGDWVLEQSTGVIDAPAFAAPDALAQFDALLNVSVSSNSLSGWIAVTPANSQNDGTGDQQTGSGSVSQDIVGDATYRAAYVKYDNGGTAGDLSDDWLAFRIRVNNQDSVNPATPSFKNFAFFGVDADNNGSVDLFAGIYNPANNSGRIGVYDANGSGNTGPSDTGINGTPIIKYDSATTGYASLYSVLASGDGSSFSGDADYFVSFQVRIADINANKAAFGLTSSLTQSTVLRYIVGTAAQDNAFNQDVSGVTGSYSGSTQTWGQLGAYTAPVQADGSVPLAASADYASATEKGGTSNGSVGVDPAGYLLANDAGTGISVTKVQAGAIVGASASTVSVGSTSALNASVVQGSYGTLTIGADGSYGYAVNNGLAAVQTLRSNSDTLTDSFTYRITDSAAGTSDATLTVTIHGANDAPVITSGSSGTVAENASPATVIYTVTATDVDAGDTKAYALKSGVGDQALLIIDSSTGAVTLKASADYETKASYSFTVVATDAAGLTDEKVVTAAVTNVNEAPVAVADTALATEKGGTANGSAGVDPTGNVLSNDTDVDAGDTKAVSAVTFAGSNGTLGQALAGSYGSLTLNADGSYSYAVNNSLSTVQALRTSSDTLTETFSYTMRDAGGLTSTSTLAITIRGANDAPLITSGSSGTVAENASPATVIYTATASDVDAGDTKAYALKSGVGDQALLNIDSSTGAVTLKASADYETKASYSFTVVVTDAGGLTDEKLVTVAVTNVNEAPVAVADTALATEKGGTANGSAGVDPTGNVLSNDTDVDAADTKTVTAVRMGSTSGTLGQALAGSYGSLTLNTNGSYSYAVNNSLSTVQALRSSSDTLTDTFSYTMRDAGGLTSASTLSITIRGANDAPVITSGSSGNVAENSSPAVAIYTATASDVDAADTKSYSLKAGVGDEALLNINSSTGVVTLKVAANFEAKPSYAFTVVATDGGGLTDEKLVTVAVTNVNEAPAAAADTALATEKGGTANGGAGIDPTGNVLSNDSDVDAGDTQAVSALSFAGSNGTVGQALAGSYGSLTLNADGSYAYALNNANATVQALRTSSDTLTETFSYTMRDAGGLTSTSTLSITIRGANDAPVITSGSSGTVAENASAATVIHTATATDVDAGDTKAYGLKSGVGDEALLNIDAGTGAVTLKASADYETKTSYNFTVVATDAGGLTNEKLVTVAVTNVNEAPVAVADTALATEKGGTANGSAGVDPTGNVLSNDTDVDAADTKTVNAARMGSTSGTLGQALAGSYGSLTLNADGSYAYALNNANATVQALRSSSDTLTEAFSYTMRDAGGLTSTGTLSITIRGANDAPFAEADSASATERGSAAGFDSSGNVLTNDADVDAGDSKAVSEVNGSSHSVGQALAGQYGSLTLDADGSYRYTVDNSNPVVDALNAGDTLTDRFSYTVTDSEGLTSTSTLAVTIHGTNDAPLASTVDPRSVTVGEPMTPLTVPAFTDVDSATLTYTATLADGSALPAWLSFDPASRTFSGTPPIGSEATLPVRVSGSDGSQSDHVDFSLVVANPPVPQAAGDAADANEAGGVANGNAGTDAGGDALDNDSGTRLTVTRVGAGTDLGGDALTLGNQNPAEIVGSYGTLSMQADGRFHYEVSNSQPAVQALNVGDTLTERFSYEVTDQAGQTSMATITITVHGTNDVPTAAAQSTTTVTNGEPLAPLTVPVFADVDSASLSYSATLADGRSLPAWLSFDSATRTFSGTPPSSFTGTLGLTVHGDDGHADASLHFNLVVVNPGAPIALDDTGRASEQGAVAGSAASGDLLANDSGTAIRVREVDAGNSVGSDATAVGDGSTLGGGAARINGSHGTLLVAADGSYRYELRDALPAVDALSGADTMTDVFAYQIADPSGQTAMALLTITIQGANDAPVITSERSGMVAENAENGVVIYIATAADVDSEDTQSYSLKSGVGDEALLNIDRSTGEVTLKVPADYEVQTSYDFTVVVTDAGGLTDERAVTVVVTNVNEAPVAAADTAVATEKGDTSNGGAGVDPTGNVLSNDSDVDAADAKTVTAVRLGGTSGELGQALAGSYGNLTLNADGSYEYRVDNSHPDVEALNAGATLTDIFSYTVRDADGLSSTSTLSITIRGANDAPVITSGSGGTVAENASAIMAIYTATASDVDAADTKSYSLKAGVGDEALLSMDSSTGAVTLRDPADFESKASYSFTVVATDAAGLTDEKLVTVAVSNVNEAPVAVADTALATEKGGTANGSAGVDPTGNVLANDTDIDAGDTLTVSAVSVDGRSGTVGQALAGSYGVLSLNADGSYGYVLDNANAAVQALRNSSDTLTDTFSYTVRDADGLTSASSLTVTIHGANDAPVAAAVAASPLTGGAPMAPLVVPAFADVDSPVLNYTATLADGSALPSWLHFDASARTLTGTPPAAAGTLSVRITGDDGGAADSVIVSLVIHAPPQPAVIAPVPVLPLPPVANVLPVVAPAPAVSALAPVELPARLPEPTPIARATLAVTPAVPMEAGRLPSVAEPVATGELYTDSRGFRVMVQPSNVQQLSVFRGISDQFVERGSHVKFNLPQDAFMHARPDQVVRLSARLADGRPLPAWLQFDAADGSFTGSPPADFEGEVRISVVARDGTGHEAATLFRLNVEEPHAESGGSSFSASMRDALPFSPAMPPLPALPPDQSIESVLLMEPAA